MGWDGMEVKILALPVVRPSYLVHNLVCDFFILVLSDQEEKKGRIIYCPHTRYQGIIKKEKKRLTKKNRIKI